MKRRGLFKLFGAALVLPFLPKTKTEIDRVVEATDMYFRGVPMTYQEKLADIRHRQTFKLYEGFEKSFWQAPGDANDLST